MRLLHVDDFGRVLLTDFSGRALPPYAILSHRWGSEDSEVLFEDVVGNSYGSKAAYQKIAFCAEQAAQDQLRYFWIDTCCIDRYNRHERSRAVNSMFRWYQNAAKCYVFLADVSIFTAEDVQRQSEHKFPFRVPK